MITIDDHTRDVFVERADEAGVLDLTYYRIDSPYGRLLLVASPAGLLRIAFEREDHDRVLQHLADTLSPRLVASTRRLAQPARELDEYFAGTRRSFGLALDLRLSRGFRREVLDQLLRIGYGTTTTYTALAAAAGRPRAIRAAGSACATNPLSIVVPCHRVIRSDGSIREYLGGTEMKRALLSMEAA